MKILIVALREIDRINYQYLFPLGLAYIASVLKEGGHEVDCLNHNHYVESIETLLGRLIKSKGKYDFVCTGGISHFYRQIKMVVDAVRKLDSKAGIILGGGIVSSEPELMFNTLKPDYIVIGEGEKTIRELLDVLEKKGDIANVAGIGYRASNGNFVCNKPQTPIMDLDSIPWPDLESFEFRRYIDSLRPTDQYFYDLYNYPRAYPIICSRSCPLLCTFCFHPLGNKYRQRSVDSLMQELTVMVRRYRINIIAIYDELFSNNREWVYEFCRRIKKYISELPWECKWGCQMRVDIIDDEILKVMKDAGCYLISYGFESYSPAVLGSMKKHITPQQIDRAVELTLTCNISIQANFIFGDIAETTQTARETLDYWKQHIGAGIQLGFVQPYPGTQLYQNCLKRKIIKDKLDFISNGINGSFINMTEAMSDKELKKLEYDIYDVSLKYTVYVVPHKLRKNIDGTADFCVKCPYCGEIVAYNNMFVLYYYFTVMTYCRLCSRRFFIVSGLYKKILRIRCMIYSIAPSALRVIVYGLFKEVRNTVYNFIQKPVIKKFIRRVLRVKR